MSLELTVGTALQIVAIQSLFYISLGFLLLLTLGACHNTDFTDTLRGATTASLG